MSAPTRAQTRLVGEAMHHGVIETAAETPLHEAAAEMAAHRVHCLVVPAGRSLAGQAPWAILSDMDLMRAIAADAAVTAGELAATEVVTVLESQTVREAARLMADHECAHLLVVSGGGGPVGVISTLDVAAASSAAG